MRFIVLTVILLAGTVLVGGTFSVTGEKNDLVIKYNDEVYEEQYKHLEDEEKNKIVEHYFGKINKRCVLYRGKTKKVNNIQYLNVEEYLLNLK